MVGSLRVGDVRRGSQMVRRRSAKPLCIGSIPIRALISARPLVRGDSDPRLQFSIKQEGVALSGPKPKPFECAEPVFWYLVGLIATDGCLSSDGRHVAITAKDKDFLEQIRRAAGLSCLVSENRNSRSVCHRLQIGSRILYDKLLAIGLTPQKSLILGPLQVPDGAFSDFLRGVIDGDGGIRQTGESSGLSEWSALRRRFCCGFNRPFGVYGLSKARSICAPPNTARTIRSIRLNLERSLQRFCLRNAIIQAL